MAAPAVSPMFPVPQGRQLSCLWNNSNHIALYCFCHCNCPAWAGAIIKRGQRYSRLTSQEFTLQTLVLTDFASPCGCTMVQGQERPSLLLLHRWDDDPFSQVEDKLGVPTQVTSSKAVPYQLGPQLSPETCLATSAPQRAEQCLQSYQSWHHWLQSALSSCSPSIAYPVKRLNSPLLSGVRAIAVNWSSNSLKVKCQFLHQGLKRAYKTLPFHSIHVVPKYWEY